MSTPAAPTPGGRPPIRIADRDRTAASEALGEHYAAGRITREEYDERSERIWTARVAADLQPLFLDLPAPHPPVLGGARPPSPGRSQGPASPTRPPWTPGSDHRSGGRGFRFPLGMLLLIVLGIALFAEVGWPVFVVVAVLWCTGVLRPRRRHSHAQASGSERPSRGSCW